jgi:hypothetical protein
MIAGNSLKRNFYGPQPDPQMSAWTDSDKTQQALMEKGLGFNCLNYSAPPEGAREYHFMRPKDFVDAQCKDGIRAELTFPSCWDGTNLDSDNHTIHVAYPDEILNGKCPDTHPVRLPTLFYETIYQTNLFAGNPGQFVFANGDPRGDGYHGDFFCAWEDGVLQSAIDSPPCLSPNDGNQGTCPVFDLQPVDDGPLCSMQVPEALQNEQIDGISTLPGNVAIQSGPDPATVGPATSTPNTTAAPSPAVPTPGGSATITSAPDVTSCPPSLFTTTSSYMSEGVLVNMVLIEEIITITMSEAPTVMPARHKRYIHKHGHRFGRR